MSHSSTASLRNWKVNFPKSIVTVDVSVINSTAYLRNLPGDLFLKPVYAGVERFDIPDYSILIYHKPSGQRLLYDLGLRKNWKTHLSPHLLASFDSQAYFDVDADVAEIIADGGISPSQINAIIYSHHHFDHTGDTSLFPISTPIFVGPGYVKNYLPGWPIDPNAHATTSDIYQGREIHELSFESGSKVCQIGPYSAYDWFSDGSFYLLSTPGHTSSHLSGLARTTVGHGDDTFIFLGGDITHHSLLMRPTRYLPLPDSFQHQQCSTSEATTVNAKDYIKIHRLAKEFGGSEEAKISPFCLIPHGPFDEDPELAQRTLDDAQIFDGDENVFTVFTHDESLLDVIEFFPKTANDWKAKDWAEKSRWTSLKCLN